MRRPWHIRKQRTGQGGIHLAHGVARLVVVLLLKPLGVPLRHELLLTVELVDREGEHRLVQEMIVGVMRQAVVGARRRPCLRLHGPRL